MHVLLEYLEYFIPRVAMRIDSCMFGWPDFLQIRSIIASVVTLRVHMVQLLRFRTTINSSRLAVPDEYLSCGLFTTGTMLLPVGVSGSAPVLRGASRSRRCGVLRTARPTPIPQPHTHHPLKPRPNIRQPTKHERRRHHNRRHPKRRL